MKSSIYFIIISFISFATIPLLAQETLDNRNVWVGGQSGYVVFGELAPLKGQSTFNVIVDMQIPQMGVTYEPDSVYVEKRVTEWNAERPGKGDKWLSYWNDSKDHFKAVFIAGMNEKLSKEGIQIGLDDFNSEYTMILKTKHMMEFMNAIFIIPDIYIVKTEQTSDTVAHVRCPVNNSALGSQYCVGTYEQAYYTTGALFGRYLRKTLYK